MNFKLIITFILTLIIALSGCGNIDNSSKERQGNIDLLDPSNNGTSWDKSLNDKLGYVRYTKDEVNNQADGNPIYQMDRTKMADTITMIILQNEGFEEVATLVTGQEVLIAYHLNENLDTNAAADIAKKSAMTIMPRFFEIYVSDNDVLINDIHSLHNSSTKNNNYQNTIDIIINEMNKSSQGQDVHADE